MKKRINVLVVIVIVVLVLGCVGEFVYFTWNNGVERSKGYGFEVSGFTTVERVSVKNIKAKLKEISELSTYEGVYKVKYGKERSRKFIDTDAPGTKNSITIKCKGVVKVGYDLRKTDIVVDHNKKIISITLPKQEIFDNYIIWDTVECTEKNNIFNPIDLKMYNKMINDIEVEGLKKVQSKNISYKAEQNMKKLIKHYFSDIRGYKVEIN